MDNAILDHASVYRLGDQRRANKVGQISAMALELHSSLATGKILSVLVVTAQAPLESDTRVKSDDSVRIREASITSGYIRVTPRTVRLVPDRLGHAL